MEYPWQIADDDTERGLPPGSYPVLICYGSLAGYFPDSAFWDGAKWSKRYVSHFMRRQCENETQAEQIAYENDPTW